MKIPFKTGVVFALCIVLLAAGYALGAAPPSSDAGSFPRSLESYNDADAPGIWALLLNRVKQEPFNLVATLIFFCAIIHTFLTSRFLAIARKWDHAHEEKKKQGLADKYSVHHGSELFHFLGEVEAVFGIWAVALFCGIIIFYDWSTVINYTVYRVNYAEAAFVVVIMTLAATRPILKLSELIMAKIAKLLGGTLTAWWFAILTLGPILGSFITEPAAMTISALLLSHKLYDLQPSTAFKYGTLGLLFVNISVGGTLTHFAAPPVLMVSSPWQWTTVHMLSNFGWKAVLGILISNSIYFLIFRKELANLQDKFALRALKTEIQKTYLSRREIESETDKILAAIDTESGFINTIKGHIDEVTIQVKGRLENYLKDRYGLRARKEELDSTLLREAFEKRFEDLRLFALRKGFPRLLPEGQRPPFHDPEWDDRDDPVPSWVTIIHVLFMVWTIVNAHYPPLFILGFLFYLGFAQVTSPYQNRINLQSPLLVGFFLAGLVIHGGVQGWWIEPVLGKLTEMPLMAVATILTAFNDNAAITFLSTLVPGFTDSLKYAVVAGAVAGGGLTVIANAPNPAGQAILKKYFDNGVSPAGLLVGAIVPTVIVWLCFLIF
jgi:hypothetical protein